jgi:hypothetical protein
MVWHYVQDARNRWLDYLFQQDKGSVIGHIALCAKMSGQAEPLVFSNTGGNVGFYKAGDYQHDRVYRLPILASFNLLETLAGHLGDGHWETLEEFRERINQRTAPKVQKEMLTGEEATRTFAFLQEIMAVTTRLDSGPGAPRHFGLNIARVRLLSNFSTPLKMKRYMIGGRLFEVHGGCANAVASVLNAARLQRLVPNKARMEMNIDFRLFRNSTFPVLVGSGAYAPNGTARDPDLVKALDQLPAEWGTGEQVKFCDPS